MATRANRLTHQREADMRDLVSVIVQNPGISYVQPEVYARDVLLLLAEVERLRARISPT